MVCSDKKRRKFNPRPKINYPPVPTKRWIPPDLRRKKIVKPPQLMYRKPPGLDQKSRPTALKKIWRRFMFQENTAILTGTFCQTHKRFTFKSNGLQSACNCALACVFAHIRPMDTWDKYLMDYILILGDLLFRKSLEQDPERCWTEIPTERVYNSVYVGTTKISFDIELKNRVVEELSSVNEDKIKRKFQDIVQKFFKSHFCGLFTMAGCKKVLAFWYKDHKYYLFDPTAHTLSGIICDLPPVCPGCGVSIIYRCNTMTDFINRLYENITCRGEIILESLAHCHCWGATGSKFSSKYCRGKFWVEPCTVLRVTEIDITPPETFEDVKPIQHPHECCFQLCYDLGRENKYQCKIPTDEQIAQLLDQPVDVWERRLRQFLEDEEADNDPKKLEIEELSPEVTSQLSLSKRPSWLQEPFEKSDFCKFPIPHSSRPDTMTFFIDVEPGKIGIMRAGTHSRDTNFTKYMGRQSMGNAISALTMLKFWKSKNWVPVLLNRILKFGDLLYREAMISIPRTQSLKLSNFQRKTEYMGKYFLPVVEDYVVVGRLSCSEFDVLDLFTALESFLIENECCVIIGPITLAVWVEEGKYYMFDPNERDSKGRAVGAFDEPMKVLDCVCPCGKACLMRFTELKLLADLYMNNLDKSCKNAPFYLSKVQINDWVDIPEAWYNFKGLAPGKWILRGTLHQGDRKFDSLSRNFQSPATSMVVMAMKMLKPIKEWLDTDVNELLDLGDRLYLETVEKLKEKEMFRNKMLMLSDINKDFRFWNKLIEFNIDECTSVGIFTAKNHCDVLNLYKALVYYFVEYDLGIVTCRNMSVAVWKFDDMFFYCDSHSRDPKGLTTPFGTACVVRTCGLEDIAEMIMCNFAPNPEDYFNITNVKMRIFDIDDKGYIVPIICYYRKITRFKYILRSLYSLTHNKYELNAGKQFYPTCILAVSYNKLKPSVEWNQADIDEIMNKGDNLYTQSMLNILQKEETEFIALTMDHDVNPKGGKKQSDNLSERGSESTKRTSEATTKSTDGTGDSTGTKEVTSIESAETPELLITLDNMKREFYIGLNKFTFITETIATGNIETELREAVTSYFEKGAVDENSPKVSGSSKGSKSEPGSTEGSPSAGAPSSQETQSDTKETAPAFIDNSNMELLVSTDTFSVTLWKDSKMFYVFDPNSRDKDGMVFGYQDFSDFQLNICQKTRKSEMFTAIPNAGEGDGGGDAAGDDKEGATEKITEYSFEEGEGMKGEEEEFVAGEYEAVIEGEILYPKVLKGSPSFWAELAKSGRACVTAYIRLEDAIEHILTNIRPRLRYEGDFELKTLRVSNTPERKDIMRPGDLRNDVYEGDWYDFKEVDRGIWILRGTLSLFNDIFPIYNRGRQQVMTSVCALAIVYTFGVICFNENTVDTILKYGDRLLTFAKKVRKKQMKEYDPDKICDDEIDWILQHEEFGIADVPKKICIWKFMVEVECRAEVVCGDIRAEPFERLTDVQRGVDKFFEENRFGILQSKDLAVAIWKGGRLFYMCDGLNRGPNGLAAACGVGCITRFTKTEQLVKTFLKNMTRLGKNNFWIHSVTFGRNICPRVRCPKVYIPPKLQCVANVCREIIPGKTIVRGSINQDDPKFGKRPNTLALPIAFTALTMTLIHKTQIWSKPILDDIIEIGNELYDISVDSLGFEFNPWEDQLNLCQVKHDFYVGILRANLEVRNMDQKGIIEPPDPCTFNLRMGIEKFFEENTHGVVLTKTLTVAIWEEEIEGSDPLIYIFDPNSRGPTGLPTLNGVCCLISCNDARMTAAHICSCIMDHELRQGPFRIVPVEIVIGSVRTNSKLKKIDPTGSLMVLPRCSQDEKLKEKRLMRKLAEFERKRRQYRAIQLIGRKNWYTLKTGDQIIRGYRAMNSECYPESSRNNQDLPMCIVAIVMHTLFSIESWTYKNIDLVMDTGNQLYLDSYIAYGPRNVKLGPENIIRKFFLRHLIIKAVIYKPIITEEFTACILNRVLNIYFSQESFCMLEHYGNWLTLIAKSGHFYMFDPHNRDVDGNRIINHERCYPPGSAVVLKCGSIERLVERIIGSLSSEPLGNEKMRPCTMLGEEQSQPEKDAGCYEDNEFTLWLISVQIR